jgi:hypothetical protein
MTSSDHFRQNPNDHQHMRASRDIIRSLTWCDPTNDDVKAESAWCVPPITPLYSVLLVANMTSTCAFATVVIVECTIYATFEKSSPVHFYLCTWAPPRPAVNHVCKTSVEWKRLSQVKSSCKSTPTLPFIHFWNDIQCNIADILIGGSGIICFCGF